MCKLLFTYHGNKSQFLLKGLRFMQAFLNNYSVGDFDQKKCLGLLSLVKVLEARK